MVCAREEGRCGVCWGYGGVRRPAHLMQPADGERWEEGQLAHSVLVRGQVTSVWVCGCVCGGGRGA
jgi:hypothetical protein